MDVNTRLREAFGPRLFRPGTEHALDALLGTILTQNTSDIICSRAFSQLRSVYGPTLQSSRALLEAPADELADVIADAGLHYTKAARIQTLLRRLCQENGTQSLEFLKGQSSAAIARYLANFKGLGSKTISCVGLYCLEKRDFPVDTHVYRFCARFGWVPILEHILEMGTAPVPAAIPPSSAASMAAAGSAATAATTARGTIGAALPSSQSAHLKPLGGAAAAAVAVPAVEATAQVLMPQLPSQVAVETKCPWQSQVLAWTVDIPLAVLQQYCSRPRPTRDSQGATGSSSGSGSECESRQQTILMQIKGFSCFHNDLSWSEVF